MKTLAFLIMPMTVTVILSATTSPLAHADKKGATGSPGAGADRAAAPPVDPYVKKTVDAFDGAWTCDNTVVMPGAPGPAKVKENFSCKRVAMDQGVVCDDHVKDVPGIGPIDGTFLFGYDQDAKAVHMFAVNSLQEVHDHKCVWRDDRTLACEPLKGRMGGDPTTEEITLAWPRANVHTWTVVITLKDGSKMNIDATCTRGNRKLK